jgi:hypothetical protein
MMRCGRSRFASVGVFALAGLMALGAGCRRKAPSGPPAATPSVSLNHAKAPLGSPLEITYRFVVASDAHFDKDYRVMMHVVDSDEEFMWEDDHYPPVPTTKWKAGETVEYMRTVFVPIYPYVGEASIQVGLYSTDTQKRLALSGDDVGQRAYRVGRVQLLPQTENVPTLFKDGWHPAEVADKNAAVEWRWTKKSATLAFKNPGKDAVFYLDLDNPGSVFREPQQVQLSLGGRLLKQFTLKPADRVLEKLPLAAAQLGTAEMAEMQIDVDKSFVPALSTASSNSDPRELGVRVFHAYVDPR